MRSGVKTDTVERHEFMVQRGSPVSKQGHLFEEGVRKDGEPAFLITWLRMAVNWSWSQEDEECVRLGDSDDGKDLSFPREEDQKTYRT